MRRLGEILVSMGVLTQEQVRAALENQVIFGGRLGTSLLELGLVTEEALADALARRHGGAVMCGDREIDPGALALLRPEHVDRLEIVPYEVEGRRLTVLALDPSDFAKLDEVAFATGKQVRVVVIPQARLWALMERYYGVSRHRRGMALGPGEPAEPTAEAPPPETVGTVLADLMDEEQFAAVYESPRRIPPFPRDEIALPPSPEHDPVPGVPPPSPGHGPSGATARGTRPAPPRADAPRLAPSAFSPPAAAALGGAMVSNDQILAALQAEAAERSSPATPPVGLAVGQDPRLSPIAFEEAVAALAAVIDRNGVARAVLQFAISRFTRAVLLAVGDVYADVVGGAGAGVTPAAMARLRLRVDQPGIVSSVVASRAQFLGPLVLTEQNISLVEALGGGAPMNALCMPILVRGRAAHVLYADNGGGGAVEPSSVGDLLILASKSARRLEALLGESR